MLVFVVGVALGVAAVGLGVSSVLLRIRLAPTERISYLNRPPKLPGRVTGLHISAGVCASLSGEFLANAYHREGIAAGEFLLVFAVLLAAMLTTAWQHNRRLS